MSIEIIMINSGDTNRLIETFRFFSDGLEKIAGYICIILLAFMSVIVFFNVIGRYVFFHSITWAEEIARFSMSWVSLLATGIALKKWLHPGIQYFIDLMPAGVSKKINILVKIIILVFLLLLVKEGITAALFAGKYQQSPALRLSMFWPMLSVPVGAFFMIVHLIYIIILDFYGKKISTTEFYE